MSKLVTHLRESLITGAVLAVACLLMAQTAGAQRFIPFTDVDPETGEVRVRAPFVRVETGPRGTRVRAPFTRVRSRDYSFPYTDLEPAPPRPATGDVVRVEIDASVKVLVPKGREGAADANQPTAVPPDRRRGRDAPAAPDLGDAAPFPDAPKPSSGKEAPPAPKPEAPENPSKDKEPAGPTIPVPKGQAPTDQTEKKEDVSPQEPSADELAVKADRRPFQPSYLVIPLGPSDPIPRLRVKILRVGKPEVPADGAPTTVPPEAIAPPAVPPVEAPIPQTPVPPAGAPTTGPREPTAPPSARPGEERIPRTSPPPVPVPLGAPAPQRGRAIQPAAEVNGRAVYELRPMWHSEVPRFFEPVEGLHLFALVHPFTMQTVFVEVSLPSGRPLLEVDRDEVEFDYGRYEVEIDFDRRGGVSVEYDN